MTSAIDFINGGPLPPTPTEDSDSDLVADLPDRLETFGLVDTAGEVWLLPGRDHPFTVVSPGLYIVRNVPDNIARALGRLLRAEREVRATPEEHAKRIKNIARAARRKWGKP